MWLLFSHINIIDGLSTFFNWLLLFMCGYCVYCIIKYTEVSRNFVIRAVIQFGALISTIIVISLIFNIGIPTYSNTTSVYGFGTTSYYIATNVIGLLLVVSLWVACMRFYFKSNHKNLFFIILIWVGAFCIGTRTGIIVSTLVAGGFLLSYAFYFGSKKSYRYLIMGILIPILVFAAIK